MSRFEKICWESSTIHMKVTGVTNIPELISPLMSYSSQPPPGEDDCGGAFSPTPSIDSGRSTSCVLSPSPKYLIHGGPGFSLALLDSTAGTTQHLPVPVPTPPSRDIAITDNFSLSEVLCASFAGDAQIWVGTETGSLHVFDLTPELRLCSHAYTKFPDSISCIVARQPSLMDESLPVINGSLVRRPRSKTEVLIGSSNGNLTIIAGEGNERGGLKNPFKCPRKVIQLGDFEKGGSFCVNNIALVSCSSGDTYWCGCGTSIVVLQHSDWRQVRRLDGCAGLPTMSEELLETVHISQLMVTEVGVWSSISHSSTVVLWDSETFDVKLEITCHNHCTTEGVLADSFAQITAINFSYPLLFVGTRGGHLLSFKIQEDLMPSPGQSSGPSFSHRIVAGAFCCAGRPVVSIHSTPVSSSLYPSPLPPTPLPTMHILVLLGNSENSSPSKVGCLAQMYELSSSPRPSPLNSPMQSLSSFCSLSSSPFSSSFSARRNSLAHLPEGSSSLPKLSLVSAAKTSQSFLPLPDSD